MAKFIIERDFPGAGSLTPEQLNAISQKSCCVIQELTGVQWVESFVTEDKLYCIYIAPDEGAVREHARRGEFPCDRVTEVRATISPETAKLNAGS
jgi:hypothetical protein